MNKFKKGDKVRYIGEGEFEEFLFSCNKGDEFIVDEADDDSVTIYMEDYFSFNNEDLELVERIDPTTAFLTELQNLMRKYDAEIGYRSIGDIWFCYLITVGGQSIKYEMDSITPDNIFDYEK